MPSGFQDDVIDFSSYDRMLLFTDGLGEARNGESMLGAEGLAEIMGEIVVGWVLHRIFEKAKDYSDGKLRDDAAAVLIMMLPLEDSETDEYP